VRKSGKLVSHVVNSNIALGSLPTLQLSLEKIYDGEPILTVFSNVGEDYNTVVAMKDIM
jgi:hypothetical protein